MRLELTQAYAHYHLKVACIPISPPRLFWERKYNALLSKKKETSLFHYLTIQYPTILLFTIQLFCSVAIRYPTILLSAILLSYYFATLLSRCLLFRYVAVLPFLVILRSI